MSNTYECNYNDHEWFLKGQKCMHCNGNSMVVCSECYGIGCLCSIYCVNGYVRCCKNGFESIVKKCKKCNLKVDIE